MLTPDVLLISTQAHSFILGGKTELERTAVLYDTCCDQITAADTADQLAELLADRDALRQRIQRLDDTLARRNETALMAQTHVMTDSGVFF